MSASAATTAAATAAVRVPSNGAVKMANSRILQARRVEKQNQKLRLRAALTPRVDEMLREKNRLIEKRNVEYLRVQTAAAQRREESRQKQLDSLARGRVQQLAREQALAERRAAMETLRLRREEKLNVSRREYLRVLNEDVMSWNYSPDELEFARYRIINPERFRLFNH